MKICSECAEEKDLSEYYTRSTRCIPCRKLYNQEHYQNNKDYYVAKAKKRNDVVQNENRQLLLEYLMDHNCVDCGSDDLEVLEFDHRDETLKTYNIGSILNYKWETIRSEIDKCDVRCRNCHIRRTRRQFGWWMRDLTNDERMIE